MTVKDVRSRKVLSVYWTTSANSDGTIIAFRKACEKYGIPCAIYLDNGREFLVHDFGGKGKRKTDDTANYGTTILERLSVDMHNANVGNAKAKVIERAFRDVTFDLSKLVKTYCGGKPEQRPHRLNELLKNKNNIPLLSEMRAITETYFEGWHNEKKSLAQGLNGKSPNECYNDNFLTIRRASKDELDLMLLRSTRAQKVKRNGVMIKIGDTEVWFYDNELVKDYMGHNVFVRYNPESLQQVHVYDEKERFISLATLTNQGGYTFNSDADIEVIKENSRRKRKQKQGVNDFMGNLENIEKAPPALSVLVEVAKKNIENAHYKNDAGVIELVRLTPSYPQPMAVGEEMLIDMKKMISNANARKGDHNGI